MIEEIDINNNKKKKTMEKQIDNNLIDRVYQFLQATKDQQLQIKPDDFDIYNNQDFIHTQDDLQTYKRDYSTKIDKQLKIIGQNIIDSFFGLSDQKYMAVLSRIAVWGYQLTMQQFIINYYLYIKKDNKLRQFIMIHKQKIIKFIKIIMQKQLVLNMNQFKFTDELSKHKRKELLNKKYQNQKKLQQIKPTNLVIKQQDGKGTIKDQAEENDIQQQILAKLKEQHPKLEQDI